MKHYRIITTFIAPQFLVPGNDKEDFKTMVDENQRTSGRMI
jgi:hypothetical protein